MVRGLKIAMLAAALTALAGWAPTGAAVSHRPGVTDTEIRVGGVASGRSGKFASAFDGVDAYFQRENGRGGVFGRDLVLTRRLDDRGLASGNVAANRRLIRDRKVFAVLPESTRTFAGARYLAAAGLPTFGWNVNTEWSEAPNLFGDGGSYTCFTCSVAAPAYVAGQLHATTAAVLAPAADPGSTSCGVGLLRGLDRYGVAVPVVDDALTRDALTDDGGLDAAVQRIGAAGVQLVVTCGLDVDELARLAQALRAADLGAVSLYAQNGYDPQALRDAGPEVDGLITAVDFAPWESPRRPPGTRAFLAAMRDRGLRPTEAAQAGWIGANLLVAGIRASGESFTRADVVAAVNAMTAFTADGILAGVDWSNGGHGPARTTCTAFVEARGGAYTSRFGAPGQPFVCFPDNPLPDTLALATPGPSQPTPNGTASSP